MTAREGDVGIWDLGGYALLVMGREWVAEVQKYS